MIGAIPIQTMVGEFSATTTNAQSNSAFGEITAPRNYILHIKPGAVLGANSVSSHGLTVEALPAGSRLIIANSGSIYGNGGPGGDTPFNIPGYTGGSALDLEQDVFIDNINGEIFSGGGGGGGGGTMASATVLYGGGGGGGRGFAFSLGGSAVGANAGLSGTIAAAGVGGASLVKGEDKSGSGGAGGDWGTTGVTGDNAVPPSAASGGVGGDPGNSVEKNSNTLVWLSGDTAANIKGSQV